MPTRTELTKIILIGAAGVAMLAFPRLGGDSEDLPTFPRLLVWAWSRPLGALLVLVALTGIAAFLRARHRPRPATPQSTDP